MNWRKDFAEQKSDYNNIIHFSLLAVSAVNAEDNSTFDVAEIHAEDIVIESDSSSISNDNEILTVF